MPLKKYKGHPFLNLIIPESWERFKRECGKKRKKKKEKRKDNMHYVALNISCDLEIDKTLLSSSQRLLHSWA